MNKDDQGKLLSVVILVKTSFLKVVLLSQPLRLLGSGRTSPHQCYSLCNCPMLRWLDITIHRQFLLLIFNDVSRTSSALNKTGHQALLNSVLLSQYEILSRQESENYFYKCPCRKKKTTLGFRISITTTHISRQNTKAAIDHLMSRCGYGLGSRRVDLAQGLQIADLGLGQYPVSEYPLSIFFLASSYHSSLDFIFIWSTHTAYSWESTLNPY